MLKGEVSLEGKDPVPAGNGRGDDKDALFRRGRWRHLRQAHAKGRRSSGAARIAGANRISRVAH